MTAHDPLEAAQLRVEALERENAVLRAPQRTRPNLLFSILIATATIVALVLISAFGMGVVKGVTTAIEARKQMEAAASATPQSPPAYDPATTSSKFTKKDIRIGTGRTATAGDKIEVHYQGTLENGTVFDSSYDRNAPFTFELGTGKVIKGWERGFDGMRVGGKRRLTIPPELAYGSRSIGKIPANSTLIFEVELLGVK